MARDRQFYKAEYIEKERSVRDIANTEGTYPNKICREIRACGYKLRDKSQAQAIAIKRGRHKHPTKGTRRPTEVKTKISGTLAQVWQQMTPQEKAKRTARGRQQWEDMTDEQRLTFRETGAKANRLANIEGSKLEKFLLYELLVHGYRVDFHPILIVNGDEVAVDLYIPFLRTVIKIDGPSHFLPIWGTENLDKHIVADAEQIEALQKDGYSIIRIKNLVKTLSGTLKRGVFENVTDALRDILIRSTPRFFEIEVK